jgi:regulator of sigma E protease
LDATPNPDHRQPVTDIASPGPIDPSTGQPDRQAEVSALKTWLRQNVLSIVISAVVIALVVIYLDPIDTLKVVLGLGFIIFIHELGHFLAAKWCDVHVKTFSIGFGPAVPFCSYKWGETTYMVGVIPLGGYVSMVGEGTGETTPDGDPDDDENDPRSFKNKSVGSRMVIISAGVIMNVVSGMLFFVAAYLHGVQEKPAVVGTVETGSAAWRQGIRTGDVIAQIDGRKNPFFDDLRPIVMSTLEGEEVPVTVERDGQTLTFSVAPLRDEEVPYPQLGVAPPVRLTLAETAKKSAPPVIPGSPAALASPGFQPGDRIVAMSDPADPTKLTPVADYDEYYRRMVDLALQPVTFHVLRKGQAEGSQPAAITVQPVFRTDIGVRMQMGKVAAVRSKSPAEKAGIVPVPLGSPPEAPGDRIAAVGVTGSDGQRTWFANGKLPEEAGPDDTVKPLDPMLLPEQLERWAAEFPAEKRTGLKVDLVVLRLDGHTERRVPVTLEYDDSFRYDREVAINPNSPLPVSGLGIAYWVQAVVVDVEPNSPAAQAGLKAADPVVAVRFRELDASGTAKDGEWIDIKPHQWASYAGILQRMPPHEIDLRIKRGDTTEEVTLKGRPDPTWGLPDRGFVFEYDFQLQKADGVGEAIELGAYRTFRFIKIVYQNLYAMIFGRVSAKTMSGPLTIASVSYKIAGVDLWQFLLFLGMISVNLAVVNFLPIPVLDGGHMLFLIYEKITGRPVPERLFAILMWAGLILILLLFAFVLRLDILRLFGWF